MSSVPRPTSPHLGIYRWQITMLLSILHRMTGVALYAGALMLVVWLVVAAYMPYNYVNLHAFFNSWLGRILMLGWVLSFNLHLANGIRHLFWDMGKGFKLRTTTISGVFVLLFTLGATAGIWMYASHAVGKM